MAKKKETKTFISITNQNIYEEIQEMHKVSRETLAQALYTNGRVTNLEKNSVGLWVSKHPIKFAMFVLAFISLSIPDVREPVFAVLKTLL